MLKSVRILSNSASEELKLTVGSLLDIKSYLDDYEAEHESNLSRPLGAKNKPVQIPMTDEMITKVEQLREWEALLEEAQNEVEELRDSIKAEMLAQGTEELQVGAYIIRWTSVLSNRFDSTAFKKEYGDLYKTFTKQVASKRFTIA